MKPKQRKMVKRALTGLAASIFIGALGVTAMAQNSPVASFENGYLNQHPEVTQQLAAHPELIDNQDFMSKHQGLREYFQHHPEVRKEIRENPREFMAREDQVNKWNGRYSPQEWGHNWNHGQYNGNGNGNWNGNGPGQGFFNDYAMGHPGIAQQVEKNPQLLNDPKFMKNHPDLREYMASHPQVRQEMLSGNYHPGHNYGNHPSNNYGNHPGNNYGHGHPLANTDNYFDRNPNIEQDLAKHPNLVNDPQYVKSHPGLEEYLNTHPASRKMWQNHPKEFLQHENQYGNHHENQTSEQHENQHGNQHGNQHENQYGKNH